MYIGDYYKRQEPLFAVDLSRKDARHALDLAAKSTATMRGIDWQIATWLKSRSIWELRVIWRAFMVRFVRSRD
jgi:hypothetical protein